MIGRKHLQKAVVSSTVELVAENVKYIKDCKGKDITIFLGREQVGKSTTINALLGVPFQICDKNEDIVQPIEGFKIHAPMGNDENEGLMCTIFPRSCSLSNQKPIYLDTQGFFGIPKNSNEIIASSILLDAAIKSASSVKIVYLEDYSNFSKGLTRIADIAKLLDRIVFNDDIPIYCLFNRYATTSMTKMKKYLTSNDVEKNEMVKEYIKIHTNKLVSAAEKNAQNLAQNISEELKSKSKENDEELMNNINELGKTKYNEESINFERSILIIQKSINEGRFGYIDPTSKWSVDNIRNDIQNLPTIDKNKLSFNYCDQQRTQFAGDFEKILHDKISPSINDVCFSLKYSPTLIEKILIENRNKLLRYRTMVSNIDKGIKNDLSELDKDLEEQKKMKIQLIANLSKSGRETDDEIQHILDAEPVKYQDYPFNEKLGFFKFWKTHVIKYDKTIPFVRVEEILCPGTIRDSIINFESNKFDESNIDNDIKIMTLKKDENPVSNFEIKYTSASTTTKAKILGAYAGFLLGTLLITATNLEVLQSSLNAATTVYVLKQANHCQGVVSFYVRYQDKEADYLEQLRHKKEHIKEMLLKAENENNKFINDGRQILTNNIAQLESNIQNLENILKNVKSIYEKWKTIKENDVFHTLDEEFTAYSQIADLLYPNPINNERIKRFNANISKLNLQKSKNGTINESGISINDIINEYNLQKVNN